ncbi:MAG: TonB-dependent receptor [Bacteroidales bacterium]|nr:TonB-dependent receptor [Bacteroidales bacterium]
MNFKSIIILFFSVVLACNVSAQLHVSGFVTDSQTGERLIGANVVEEGTNNGQSTDNNGYFSLIVKSGKVQVSFIGYRQQSVAVRNDTLLTIALDAGETLEEIVIKGEQAKQFNVSLMGKQDLLNIPSLGGKPDVLKAMQLMPGIQAQQEGSSLLNVRGGNPGENLYLIDNVPLIYVNHLGGFMSVFNPEMINNIEVFKGGFPARYGGKLSSVVAITQKEGNKSGFRGSLGIGLTDVSFSVEGPLFNKTASLMVTGRKTLIDPIMILISGLSDGGDFYVFYGFHDLNGKFTWQPDKKNSVSINLYLGDDYLKYWTKRNGKDKEKSSMGNTWGNNMASVRWSKVISPRLFADNSFSYTRYRLNAVGQYHSESKLDTVDYENNYISSVDDFSLRSDWQFKLVKYWNIDFGAKYTSYIHVPNHTTISGTQSLETNERIHTNELAGYLSNKISIFNHVDADLGMRVVHFGAEGFSKLGFEPRLSLSAHIFKTHSLNATWQQVSQYAHLVFTSGNIFNSEVWVPADNAISPSTSTQYTFGWKGAFANNLFDAELTYYHKEMNQLVAYKEGYSSLMGDGGWRKKLEIGGSGTSKGIEFLIRKTKGEWTGFLGYTYSKTTRKFPGINKGEEYLFEFDRPHSISLTVSKKINDAWSFNALWVYQTGLPYTPVEGRQIVPVPDSDGHGGITYEEAFIYGERNSDRMKDYHRLDVGFIKNITTKRGRKAQWNFSVYNVYNRHNPAAYYYGYNKDGGMMPNEEKYEPIKKYQISYFPCIPSISYKLFF